MSETVEQTSAETTSSSETCTTGCVKWFNNKSGYGFISVVDGENTGEDVFVHHSAICVNTEQYRYLVQGEYVNFKMCKADTSSHEWQAGSVRGLNGGKLMCETRHEVRSRNSTDNSSRNYSTRSRPHERDDVRSTKPRSRGQGPREGEVWEVVRKRKTQVDTK